MLASSTTSQHIQDILFVAFASCTLFSATLCIISEKIVNSIFLFINTAIFFAITLSMLNSTVVGVLIATLYTSMAAIFFLIVESSPGQSNDSKFGSDNNVYISVKAKIISTFFIVIMAVISMCLYNVEQTRVVNTDKVMCFNIMSVITIMLSIAFILTTFGLQKLFEKDR